MVELTQKKLTRMPDKDKQLPDKCFGYFAVQKEFITPHQFVEALDIQFAEKTRDGKHRLVCEILVDLEYITIEQIGMVFNAIRNAIQEGDKRLVQLSV